MDGTHSGFETAADFEAQATDQEERLARQAKRAKQRERRAWARGLLDGVLSQMGPECLAIDCGANVGEVSYPLAQTGAQVLAFEPDPVAFAALSDRLGDRDNVILINGAVGTETGTAILHRSTRFDDDPLAATVSSTLMEGKRDADALGTNEVEVPVYNLAGILADLIDGHPPSDLDLGGRAITARRLSLLKMDIEGGELSLLPALHEADLLAPVGCTLVETHQRKFPGLRRDFLQMRREIRGLYPANKVNLDWI